MEMLVERRGLERRPWKTMLNPAADFFTLLRASPVYLQLGEYKHRPETCCLSPRSDKLRTSVSCD